jgi:hypothetical protein
MTFDKFDHHKNGLIRISLTQYVRCTDACCKTGGPAFGGSGSDDR